MRNKEDSKWVFNGLYDHMGFDSNANLNVINETKKHVNATYWYTDNLFFFLIEKHFI